MPLEGERARTKSGPEVCTYCAENLAHLRGDKFATPSGIAGRAINSPTGADKKKTSTRPLA